MVRMQECLTVGARNPLSQPSPRRSWGGSSGMEWGRVPPLSCELGPRCLPKWDAGPGTMCRWDILTL